MQTVLQALENLTNAVILMASPLMVLALIIAGINLASADTSRQERSKKQLAGIIVAAIIIFGARIIVSTLISFVPGSAF